MIKKLTITTMITSMFLFTGCGGSIKDTIKDAIKSEVEQKPSIKSCTVDGDTVLVDEGTSCTNDGHTAICENSRITIDGSLSGTTVSLNGTTYTCQ